MAVVRSSESGVRSREEADSELPTIDFELPAKQRACPGKSTSKSRQANQISLLNLSFFPCFTQCNWNRSGGCISIFLDIIINLVVAQF